ncbi:unnamed protein product [Urochloa humidicola]
MDDTSAKMKGLDDDPEEKDYKFDFDLPQIDDLLPDKDELFAGITDEIEPVGQTNNTEELEEFDVFGSGGGMELDLDPLESVTASFANSSIEDGISPFAAPSTVGTVDGEHPYGEHPSRTLFVRNINSNVEDSELRSLFEQYGDIRTLYTATKHRGFVMISYFDIRSARNATHALQNKPLRRRKLDIHFSIPKENRSDKDLNQGTLVIFNLDPSVSNEEVRQIFGAYGEVKEIRETPNKKHHKFIEFYDVRAAEAALRSLNKSEIAGKKIKLEPSRPGGTRRNLMQQLGHDLDQEEPRSYRHPHVGSPIANSPPGAWAHYSIPTDNNMLKAFNRSPTGNGMSPIRMPSLRSNAMEIAPIGKDCNRSKYDQVFSIGNQSLGSAFQHSHSYQDRNSEHMSSSPGTLSGPQFLWGSPKPCSETYQSPVGRPLAIGSALSSTSRSQGQGFLHGSRQASLFGSSDQHHHHHVGSSPSVAPFESHFGFLPESPETSFTKQVRFGNMGNIGTDRNMAGRASLNPASSLSGSLTDNSSANFRPILSPRLRHALFSNPTYQGPGSFGLDNSTDRGSSHRVDSSVLQTDSKRQYQLDLEKIRKGDDTRTTLMIKNIPNKYTSKMLLSAIDELHKGTYDFFYLPIDFKNKCNVGYAFINMISPTHIVSFYQEFNGKKWEKFNIEKVASLAYARIQGRSALISHFQNSSLMNEDKRCRPILFHPNGLESAGNQAEVHALIQLRTELEARYQDSGHKGPLWEEISSWMRRLGYNRSANVCKDMWDNINEYINKVEGSNKKLGTMDSKTSPSFHELDRYNAARSSSDAGTAVQPGSAGNKPQDIMKLKEMRQPIESAADENARALSTFSNDVKAWFAMQYQGGLRHTCIQQVGPEILGRNDIRETVTQKILLDTNGGSNCTVICISAGSGHGKTSLLRVLYNDERLMDAFEKRMWIQMSDKLDILMLFRKIIEVAVNDHCSNTNLGCFQEMVKEEIADKKFLFFMDDADIEDQQFWNALLQVLKAGTKGSAVVMATRSATVAALKGVATHFYSLNPLSEQNNLMLLQQYAVVGTDIQRNPDLLMVAQRFISRFGYNPLNLKAIGGLLCHADSISLEMDKFEGSVIPLQLCHGALPIHLKKCLAFCSLFPVGYIFDKQHMVLQWISHGCVRPAEGCDFEDVGVEYFNELLCRCFFQCSPVHNEKDDKFVMHELVYKVVESVSRDKYFKSEDLLGSIPGNILHLSLVSSEFHTVELMSKPKGLKDLQTFLVVQPEWQPYKISFPTLRLVGLDNFFLKFTSLEILDLSHTDTEELPGSIGGLRNLQYLSVNNTNIRSLPSELCSLSNLQTLEAKDCRFLIELPGDTKKLLKLRHIDVTKELDYVHLPHGIGHLTELRTLPVFHASGDPSRCSISELGNLRNLRGSLRLSGLESVKTGSKAQEANLKDKHHLKDLTLQWHDGGINIDDEDEDEDTENVAEQVLGSLQPHTNLHELAIRGYEGSTFPAWMQDSSSLPNIVSLTLDGCCSCTEFPAISHLPSLKFLSVRKMYCVQRLITNNIVHGTTKFPYLELLNLWEMYGLEELFEASEGDCPRLRKVCVSRCPDLNKLPCIRSVTEMVLHCGRELPDIPELASLASLKIEGFHGVKSFSLPALPVLKKVEIRSCKELVSVDGLSALTTVQRLKVADCPKLVLPRTDSLTT